MFVCTMLGRVNVVGCWGTRSGKGRHRGNRGKQKKKTASPYHLAAMAPAAESLPDG